MLVVPLPLTKRIVKNFIFFSEVGLYDETEIKILPVPSGLGFLTCTSKSQELYRRSLMTVSFVPTWVSQSGSWSRLMTAGRLSVSACIRAPGRRQSAHFASSDSTYSPPYLRSREFPPAVSLPPLPGILTSFFIIADTYGAECSMEQGLNGISSVCPITQKKRQDGGAGSVG